MSPPFARTSRHCLIQACTSVSEGAKGTRGGASAPQLLLRDCESLLCMMVEGKRGTHEKTDARCDECLHRDDICSHPPAGHSAFPAPASHFRRIRLVPLCLVESPLMSLLQSSIFNAMSALQPHTHLVSLLPLHVPGLTLSRLGDLRRLLQWRASQICPASG